MTPAETEMEALRVQVAGLEHVAAKLSADKEAMQGYESAFIQQRDENERLRDEVERLDVLAATLEQEKDAAQDEAARLRAALEECIEGYEYACEYKGDYFIKKHGDAEAIAKARAALGEVKP